MEPNFSGNLIFKELETKLEKLNVNNCKRKQDKRLLIFNQFDNDLEDYKKISIVPTQNE